MSRGKLRVYLGAAPGVGKTCAMLDEGARRAERGTDVVVGLVETHDRPYTLAKVGDLEVVPRKVLEYRGGSFTEMDTDAIIARRPAVALIDELAHTNVPGSRNEKRWQDVHEILDAGIDVVTTVNIQHLESLNDVVESITGIRQQETLPDAVVRAADQIQLEDMTPEALRRRLAHGNVYKAEKIDAALANYFRVGNLGALRELALLWVADRVDEALEQYRREQEITQTWAARTRIVVALSGVRSGEILLRRGAVVAGRSEGRDLMAVHVIAVDGSRSASTDILEDQRRLAEELGASFHTVVGDDPAQAILDFARSVNATLVVIGQSMRGRVSTLIQPSTADLVVRGSGDIDVQVVTYDPGHRFTRAGVTRRQLSTRRALLGLATALLLPATLALVLYAIAPGIDLTTLLLLLLMTTVVSVLIGGWYAAVAASITSVAAADFLFVPPHDTFNVATLSNVIALLVFLGVGCVIAYIIHRSAALAAESARRRAEAEALTALTTNVLTRQSNFSRGLLEQVCLAFGMHSAAIFTATERGGPMVAIEAAGSVVLKSPNDCDVAVDAGQRLLLGTAGRKLSAADRRLLGAYAAHAGSCLERDRLARETADAARLNAIESARNTVVTAVIQEFRVPIELLDHAFDRLKGAPIAGMSQSQRGSFDSAVATAEWIKQLLADLLDANALHTTIRDPAMQSVAIGDMVERAVRNSGHATRIGLELQENLPRVVTDPNLLRRILGILIEGAARRASPGTRIRVIGSATHADKPMVEVRIVDRNDSGARVSVAPHLTVSGQPIAALQMESESLGNSVARQIAGLIGCGFEVEETPGGGMTAIISVPTTGIQSQSPAPTTGGL